MGRPERKQLVTQIKITHPIGRNISPLGDDFLFSLTCSSHLPSHLPQSTLELPLTVHFFPLTTQTGIQFVKHSSCHLFGNDKKKKKKKLFYKSHCQTNCKIFLTCKTHKYWSGNETYRAMIFLTSALDDFASNEIVSQMTPADVNTYTTPSQQNTWSVNESQKMRNHLPQIPKLMKAKSKRWWHNFSILFFVCVLLYKAKLSRFCS